MISIVINAASGSPQYVAAEALRHELTARIGDHMVLDFRDSVALGSENALLSAVQSGAADIAVLTGPVVGPVVPTFSVFDVPFLFRDAEHVKSVTEGPIGDRIAATFADHGLVLLAIGQQGFRNITNSKRPIHSPDDLKGLKIRVLPNDIYMMTFKALGAEVVPMEFPLVYGALKDGRIDGQENPLTTVVTSHLEQVQKYLSLSEHFFAPIALVMNKETYAALDPEDVAAMAGAAKLAAEATRTMGAKGGAENLDTLKKGGMDVVETVDRAAFLKATAALEPEFEKRFGKDLLADIRATH